MLSDIFPEAIFHRTMIPKCDVCASETVIPQKYTSQNQMYKNSFSLTILLANIKKMQLSEREKCALLSKKSQQMRAFVAKIIKCILLSQKSRHTRTLVERKQ